MLDTAALSVSTDLALRPRCDGCGEFLELRDPPGGWTPEQRFCGVWYDHPTNRCGGRLTSVLYPSKALRAQQAHKISEEDLS